MVEANFQNKIDQSKNFLLAHPLFNKISRKSRDLEEFLDNIELKYYNKDDIIYSQSMPPTSIYLVYDGEVHIKRKDPQSGKTTLVGIEGRGAIFGEVSFLSKEHRSSDAVAALNSSVYVIPGNVFLRLLSQEPSAGKALAHLLSKRLRSLIKQETSDAPARVFVMLYPENAYKGGELSAFLAQRLIAENPGPVALCAFNRHSKLLKGDGANLSALMSRWPDITINEIKKMIGSKEGSIDIIRGDALYKSEATYERIADRIPAFLGRLRKYYSVILVDGGTDYKHPVLSSLISQCDRIILFRTVNPSLFNMPEKNTGQWNGATSHCMNLLDDFFARVITVSDEAPGIALKDLNRFINRNSALYRRHIRLQRTNESPDTTGDILFRRGIGRLARKLSGTSRGLCLGGGGARAFAHAGVLEVLEREEIDFDAVTGTSMGAIIGAAHALGINASEIIYMLKKILPNSSAVLDKTIPLISFYRGKKLNKALLAAFGNKRFEDTEIPFFCNGSDLNSGRVIVFEKGYLATALRGSISLPGLFPPLKLDPYRIVDGGILNNLPGDILQNHGCRQIFGVNVTPLEDRQFSKSTMSSGQGFFRGLRNYLSVPPILKIIYRSINMEGRELLKYRMEDFNYLLHPDVTRFDIFDFHRIEEIVESGRRKTEEHLDEIKEALTRQKIEY